MDRAAEYLNSLVVPRRLRGTIREYIIHRRSGYQEIGDDNGASWWIKLIIYLGSVIAIILSIVAFTNGYVILPAISTSVVVVCAGLFWFRNSTVWGRLLECSRTIFCCPFNYFRKPVPREVEVQYDRRLRRLLFGRSVEVQTDGAEARSEALNLASGQSSESESSTTLEPEPIQMQNFEKKEKSEIPNLASGQSSESENSTTLEPEPVQDVEKKEKSDAPNLASGQSSESENSTTLERKPVEVQNVEEK